MNLRRVCGFLRECLGKTRDMNRPVREKIGKLLVNYYERLPRRSRKHQRFFYDIQRSKDEV